MSVSCSTTATQSKAPLNDGKLDEAHGRGFFLLVELGRYYANDMGAVVPGLRLEGLEHLRASPRGMQDLLLINSRMYSYWNRGPSRHGIYDVLCKQNHASEKDALKGCHAKGCDRKPSDGGPKLQACRACLVPYYCSKECQKSDWASHKKDCKVWRDGVKDSIRDMRLENLPAEVKVMRKALANDLRFWGHEKYRITGAFYAVRHTPEGMLLLRKGDLKPTVYVAQGIADSIGFALQRGGRQLPIRTELTLLPFFGRLVYDGIQTADPNDPVPPMAELEARVKEAQAQGNVVDCLELPETPPEVPAGQGAVEAPPPSKKAAKLSAAAKRALAQVAGARRDTNEQTKMWVCRRFGYTKADNPDNLAMFMAGPIPVGDEPMRSRRLEYTGEELILGLAKGVKAMRVAPAFLGVDCLPALEEVEDELGQIGITAGYYPPPSAEERRMFGS